MTETRPLWQDAPDAIVSSSTDTVFDPSVKLAYDDLAGRYAQLLLASKGVLSAIYAGWSTITLTGPAWSRIEELKKVVGETKP